MRLIDWEFSGYRSPLYDYYKFIYRVSRIDSDYSKEIFKNIKKEIFEKRLINKYLEVDEKLLLSLFILEDLNLRLFQYENRNFAKDFNKITDFIFRVRKEIEIAL
ncbi:hypothetical protein [Halobacillus andaensis]|uniref:hypothetical protein n=1 Tax=Halobacillus andaensis TaxID=1176239 RepID=UPI003D708453